MKSNGSINDADRGQCFMNQVRASMEREFTAFRNMFHKLREEHDGEYVALSDGEVIDSDKDELVLAERVSRKFADRFVVIQGICEQPPNRISIITTRARV